MFSTEIEIGDIVLCDVCNTNYTNSEDSGGFLFGSYAYCPKCADSKIGSIRSYGEEHYINAWCYEDESFADFVRRIRESTGSTKVQVTSF